MTTPPFINVLIVDSSPVYRFGLTTLLKSMSYTCTVHESFIINCDDIFNNEINYDIIFIGLSKNIKFQYQIIKPKNSKIVLLVECDVEWITEEILNYNFDAIMYKNCDLNEMTSAVKNIIAGNKFFNDSINTAIASKKINKSYLLKSPSSQLILESIMFLMYHEKTSKEISSILNLSCRTIEDYRAKILRATNSENMIGIIKYVFNNNIHNNKSLNDKFLKFCIKKNHSEIDYIR